MFLEVHDPAADLHPSTKEVIFSEMAPLFQAKLDLKTANREFYKRYQTTSLSHILAAAEVAIALDESSKEEVAGWISKVELKSFSGGNSISLSVRKISCLINLCI